MAESGQYSNSTRGASEEEKDIYCEPCHRDGLVAIADGYCKDCPDYLCAQCYKSHRRNRGLAKHVLLNKNKMPTAPDSNTSVFDECEEKCTDHPNKVIELFCVTCRKVACVICVSIDHRQCKTVKHIPDIVKDFGSTQFQMLNQNIQSTVKFLLKYEERLIPKITSKITSNTEMKKLAKQEIKHQRAEINKVFDQLEKKMNDKVTLIEKSNNDALKVVSDKMDLIKKEFDPIKNDTKVVSKGQKCGQFIALTQRQQKLTAIHIQFEDLERKLGELRVQCYTLFPSEQILAVTQSMMETKTELCRMATASLETPINIPSSTSIKCLTIVQGYLCVAVENQSKYSIKVINTKSKHVTSEINFELMDIWSITSVADDQVAVSLKGSLISFLTVSVSGVIKHTSQLKYPIQLPKQMYFSHNCFFYDMVCCSGNIYGICSTHACIGDCNINVCSMKGEIIKTIQTDDKGADLFGFLQGIAVSPDGQTIYVTDSKKHSVISLNLDGNVKTIYTDNDLKDPRGIAVDKYGYVYVHNTGTQSIQQLTADLKMFQVLLENQVPQCYEYGNNMTYSSTEHKLYFNADNHINQYSLDCYMYRHLLL